MLPVEKHRLSRQCQAIAERLEKGRVSNRELSDAFSLKYTGRISDLRKQGWNVQVVEKDRRTGLTWYALLPAAEPSQATLFGEMGA